MIDFETSKKQIASLVEEFKTNEHIYKTAAFDEENTKINFINKFFQALGWDVTNEAGVAPQFKDVEFEDTVIVGGKPKAPDYCFRIGGARIFFVEAKKPSVDIEHDRRYAFQLKRYTWSAHLPLGLLTDFEELAIYEPKTAPKKTHNTSVDRIKYYHYSEYVDNWEEIYNIFSKEAVLTGKFDQYVKNIHGDKKGTSTVDSEFLKTIEEWRLELAKNIALRNKELTVDELNFAVQLIIDRIIFLRIAEDRGIEKYGQLKKLTELARNEKDNYPVYEAFIELCRKADAKYNSGLFHFTEEKDISLSADTLTPGLKVDDGKLKKIIDGLYYPDCPYEFSMISTEILGNIYEQFLGKVIRLTDGHQAKVEDKPEVKKAGGVFYTPQYIVNYIVENTVGELLKGKTPNKVSELRIVDPACGSGSFLLGAYQKLLDWHVDYYSNLDQPPKNVIYIGKDGIPKLTIQEKKRILLNNIYGVDIDSQAVEVTKLSLLLKVLEDENKDVLEAQQKLIQERALPYLGDNIRCGNSLIGTDILEQQDLTDDEVFELNPFDWEIEFSDIFETGGFDAVIGNPPYFNIQTLGANSNYFNYLKNNYEIYMDKSDILFYFISKSSKISKGKIGFIISNAFLFSDKAKKLRNYILDDVPLVKIVNFEKYLVFNAGITTAITIFDKTKKYSSTKALTIPEKDLDKKELINIINDDELFFKVKFDKNKIFPLINDKIKKFNSKIDSTHEKLGDICLVGKGMETAADKIFSFKEYPKQFPPEFIKLRVTGKNSGRYFINENTDLLLYYEFINDFKELPNEIKEYLKSNRAALNKRATVKNEGRPWWKYSRPMHKEFYNKPKLFCSRRNSINEFSYDGEFKYLSFSNMTVIFDTNENFDLKYILALLNSKLLTFRYRSLGKQTGNGIYEYFPNGISKLPIPVIPIEEQKVFVDLADKMIELNKKLSACKTPKEKRILETQLNKTDEIIDKLVYELYELSDDEINIVEETVSES